MSPSKDDLLHVQQGSRYPALHRLEIERHGAQGLHAAERFTDALEPDHGHGLAESTTDSTTTDYADYGSFG
jgi:hypothetical protein